MAGVRHAKNDLIVTLDDDFQNPPSEIKKIVDYLSESNLDLVNRLEITSTPTTLILNRKGVEVGRAVGAPSKAQILSAIDAVH